MGWLLPGHGEVGGRGAEICQTKSQAGHLEGVCRRGKGEGCVERQRFGGGTSLLRSGPAGGGRTLQHRLHVSRHVIPQTWSLRRRVARSESRQPSAATGSASPRIARLHLRSL